MDWMMEVRRGASVLFQVDHPGDPIPDELHGGIQWRLLFPLIARLLHLPHLILFGLPHAGCLLALTYIVTVLRRNGLEWRECGLAAVMLGAASWFIASVVWLGYFDSWVVLALLFVAFARTRWAMWGACVWAPWVDERFVLGLPLAIICAWVWRVHRAELKSNSFSWRLDTAVPLALVAIFLVTRLVILGGRSGANATITGYLTFFDLADTQWSRVLLGVWEGLRAGWAFVVIAVILVAMRHRTHALVLCMATVVLMVTVLATAQDFSRSMMFIVPVAVLGVLLAAEFRPKELHTTLWLAFAASVFLPARLVMNDGVYSVFYLYHELGALRSPPPGIMPELLELSAVDAIERADFAKAEVDLSTALKLAPNPAHLASRRGDLYAKLGRWTEARRDYSIVIEHEPARAEAWFRRAQAAQALGDTRAARLDLERSLALGPKEWVSRPEIKKFAEDLQISSP
jgi:hypothetical protein